MTLCLCTMFCARDLPFITLQMPYNINAFGCRNIVTATDEVNSEAADWLRGQGVRVVPIEFHQHWSEALNQMLDQATALGFDKVIRLDVDEMIFSENVPQINRLLDQYSLLIFPRYNYFWSRTTVNTSAWPDLQYRAWRLDGRSRYHGQRHEGIIFTGSAGEVGIVDNIAWHHYGDCSKTSVYQRALRYINYERMDAGLPLVDQIPEDKQPGAPTRKFIGPQPLDPTVIGLVAPFTE